MSCSTWYIQGFWQGFACWSSLQTEVLWNFRSDIWFISSFLSKRWLQVVLDEKSSQDYTTLPLFLLYINVLSDDVICDIAIYADDTIYSKCDQASDLWQQLELASKLESDLWDTVDWGKKWLVDFNVGNFQLALFDQSNNTVSIDVEMYVSRHEKKPSFEILGLTFSSKLDCGPYIISITKTASREIGALIYFMKFLSPEVTVYLYKSTIVHVWITAVTSGLVP